MEPPFIPDRGVELLERLCSMESQNPKALELLMELTIKRPKKLHYLSTLLAFCSHAVEAVSHLSESFPSILQTLNNNLHIEIFFSDSDERCELCVEFI